MTEEARQNAERIMNRTGAWGPSRRIPRLSAHSCALGDVVAGWTRRRSAGRNPRPHMRMLRQLARPGTGSDQLTLLARVAVNVRLQRARPREPLVAHLALVLLLDAT